MTKILLLAALLAGAVQAQDITGDWKGTITTPTLEIRLALHVSKDKSGLKASMDSLDQGALGMVLSGVTFQGSTLKFNVDAAQGKYEGKLGGNGAIDGLWTQGGMPYPLKFERGTFQPIVHKPAPPSIIDGAWSGELAVPNGAEKITFTIVNTADGLTATLKNVKGAIMQVTSVTRTGGTVKMDIKAIGATYEGTLSPDLKTMNGAFTQNGAKLSLVLKR